jgi:hypothetical protein
MKQLRKWINSIARWVVIRTKEPATRIPTTYDWLRDRLNQVAFDRWEERHSNRAHYEGYLLTPFETGVLFSNKPLPWTSPAAIHLWETDFGTLHLKLAPDPDSPIGSQPSPASPMPATTSAVGD